jgi:outer membrane protein
MLKLMLTIFLLSASVLAFAQNSLTLKNAIEVALQNNFQIQITQLQSAQAKINNTWGQAGRYPSISLAMSQGNNISDQSKNPTSFIQALLISNSVQGGLDLNWTLFNGFAVKANKNRLAQVQEQSEGNAAVVIENTIQALILSYYNVQIQESKLELLRDVLQTSKNKYDYNKLKTEIGTSVSSDLLQFQNQVLIDSASLMLQEIAHRNARRNLNIIMGAESEQNYELADVLMDDFPSYDYSDLQSKMESNNQNIKNQYINEEIFRQDVLIAKSSMFPVISFNAGASGNSSSYRIADFPSQQGANLNYYGNFSLSFNVFNGGRVKRAIQSADIQTKINGLQITELKQTLNRDLIRAHELYEMRKKVYALNTESASVALKNLEIAQEKYDRGIINSFNFRDINITYLNTGIASLESLYNLVDAKTDLIRLTGGLLQESASE